MSSRISAALGAKLGLKNVRAWHCSAALFGGHDARAMHVASSRSRRSSQASKSAMPAAKNCCPKTATFRTRLTPATTSASPSIFRLRPRGHLIMLPLMPEKQHALLALGFENASHSGNDHRHGDRATSLDWRRRHPSSSNKNSTTGRLPGSPQQGAALRYPIPDYMLRTGRFYSSVRHKGAKLRRASIGHGSRTTTSRFWWLPTIRTFYARSKHAIGGRTFLLHPGRRHAYHHGRQTGKAGRRSSIWGRRSQHRSPMPPSKTSPRSDNIPLGGVSGGVYRNPDLGLQYEIPKGWDVSPAEANDDPPRDATALREHEFLHACSKTLLRIVQHGSGDAAHKAATPTIILRALDPSCLSMRIPASLTDKNAVDNVSASLEVLSEFGEISSDELVSISDHLFMVFHGTDCLAWIHRRTGPALVASDLRHASPQDSCSSGL